MLSHSLTRWPRYLVVIVFTMLAGCFASGDGEDPVSDPVLTGVLLDGPTSGVSYTTESQTGTTNANGEFSYFPGETIVFSIGGLKLGQVQLVKPDPAVPRVVVTPVELTGSTDASDPKVIRLLQLLQSLDSDGDHSNGISISETTRSAAASLVINFADTNFAVNNPTFNLQSTVDNISDPDDPVPAIVSAGVALHNFSNSIQDNGLNISLTPTFQLVWADEFNAASLDTQSWNFETGYGPGDTGWGNDEWQQYTQNSENLAIVFEDGADASNGYLKISAQCPAPGVDNAACQKRDGSITSAKINTRGKHEFQFGKIEARIKVPTGKGAWPAFWSLGAGFPETPWPASGEIDFMEVFNVNNNITKDGLFTIHWEEPDGSGTRQFSTTAKSINAENFHIFEAEWNQDRIIGKIDRVEFANYPINPATQDEFLKPFYLILNLAMGGNPLPDLVPDATTPWPQEMLVDYIRVYQAVAGLNNDIINIGFEGASEFVCFEDGSGCGSPSGFAGGDASVQANPSTDGNPSANAARFQKFNPGNGEAFGGTLVRLTDNALDFAASNNIFTVKVYSTRSVPVRLELGDDNPNDGSPGVDVVHSGSGWEELTFDVSGVVSQVTKFNQIVFIFDNGTVGDAQGDLDNGTTNWTFFLDDIVLKKAPVIDDGTGGGDFGDGSSDGTGFGVFSETNTTSAVTNTNIVSAGNTVTIDGVSTAVTPFDGSSVLALTYSGNTENQGFGGAVFQFDSANVSAFDTLKFTIDTASFTNFANLTVQLEPPGGGTAGGNVALASYSPVAVSGDWETYEIPLADFTAVNPASISALGFFNARDGGNVLLAGTLYLDDIHFTGAAGGTGGTGGSALPFSDDFESGDLAGWTATPNGGAITADNTQAGSGTFSARLVAGPAQAPAFSIEGLAAGSVAAGDTIDVSWDMCGTFAGAGEVMFPALLSEPGGGAGAIRVFDTIAAVPAVWTRFTRRFTADANAANVAAGVSVQFDVVCGGDAGCAADVFIDNVAITNGAGDPGAAASGTSCAAGGTGGGAAADVTLFADSLAPGWVGFLDANGTVTQVTDADATFGEVLELTTGGSTVVGIGSRTGDGSTINTSAFATLEFDLKLVTAPTSATTVWKLKTENPGVEIDIAAPVLGSWVNYSIPLSDLGTPNALDLIMLFADYPANAGAVYRIDNVKLVQAPPPPSSTVTLFADSLAPGWVGFLDANGTVTQVTDADATFGEVLELTTGGSTVVGIGSRTGDGSTINTSAFATLEFDLKLVTAPTSATTVWKLKTENPGVEIDIAAPVLGSWVNYSIPLSDLGTPNALDLIMLFADYPANAGAVYRIDNVKLVGAGAGAGGGAEIAVNGGLESGLTGWEATPNGGISELSTAQAHTGVNSARLRADVAANAGGASFPDIKLANVGVGTVTNGQAVTVSFWTLTVEQTGAVPFFAQLFTEQAGGGASKTDFLIQPPTFLTTGGGWQQHSFNVTLGPDASAGVSLLFKADCGATANCVLEVFIDDVSITPQ